MLEARVSNKTELKVSVMAEHLIGSEIIKLAAEVNEKIKNGERIFNYTIGDFDPKIFPIPQELTDAIISAYQNHHTNYPAANGMPDLRKAVSNLLHERLRLDYSADEILIAGGARPLIYGTFVTLLDAGDTVVFPVPSWNNNHYCHLMKAKAVFVETSPENNFMPTADEIRPYLKDATMLALCSPLNPTGTVFQKDQLESICDLILEENKRRGSGAKPLYLMYDQIYWVLTFGENRHYDPVSLRPEMKNYTIFIDGISKSLAATGVRVGWAFGPRRIMDKMRAILSHIGAWAPKAEQVATANYLQMKPEMEKFMTDFKRRIDQRLEKFYEGFMQLKKEGFRVNAIAPQAAIYLTVQLSLAGMKTSDGKILKDQKEVTQYILDEAKLALVPFSAFGSPDTSTWYRLSVGTCNSAEIDEVFASLRKVLSRLS
ncbi:MAG: aminotransferase class I/II-fold pyridoxal phosphate-dependent enzyme [Bacteroidetes bacterium]|nr:aminotransferase class I/II-fold pyridoxal phosphate-dependent enzyme [Bacteroidota bacterium]